MNLIDFHIELEPVLSSAISELKSATDDETESLLKEFAMDAPGEIKDLLGDGDRSKEGEPPTNDTFELYRSIRAQMDGKSSVLFEFAGHAFYLDPVFKGEGKGGGYLNRPFIESGLENAVRKLESV